jgi:hypothetical protein
MSQLVAYILLVVLVAYIAYSVWKGTWYGTWCASGRKPGQRLPGVHRPDHTATTSS